MNIEELRDYCLSLDDVTEKIPFGKFARRYDSLLVFYVDGHMFCMADMDNLDSVTVRSTPDEIVEIRLNHASVENPLNPAMKFWIQLNLNGDFSDTEIYALIKRAHEIVRAKYTNKKKI